MQEELNKCGVLLATESWPSGLIHFLFPSLMAILLPVSTCHLPKQSLSFCLRDSVRLIWGEAAHKTESSSVLLIQPLPFGAAHMGPWQAHQALGEPSKILKAVMKSRR